MTRKQRIQAAKAFTEREGGLEALAERHKTHLEEGYLIASAQELAHNHRLLFNPKPFKKVEDAFFIETPEYTKKRVWAFNSQGIATTEF